MDPLASIPLIGGLFDNSDQEALQSLAQNQQLYGGIQTPTFNPYQPASYTPEMAQAQTIQANPQLQGAQMNSLNNLAGLAQNGLTPVDQANFMQAENIGNQTENSGVQGALQNAASRQLGGSGLEFAMREQAGQDAANRSQQAGLQTAADSAQQRALYNQAYGNYATGLEGQQFGQAAANTGILNNFNQYNTGNRNQANMYNTGNTNQAQMYNNTMVQQGYEDQMQKAGGEAGANTGMAEGYGAENAANTSARNSNTALAAGVGMGMARMGPWAPRQQNQNNSPYGGQ